jgi:hypothetical protein
MMAEFTTRAKKTAKKVKKTIAGRPAKKNQIVSWPESGRQKQER